MSLMLGQGGQALLRGMPGVCHVLFVAPLELRVANVARWHELKESRRPARRCAAHDEARNDYLARYHNVRWLDPLLYHLVINTERVTVDVAVALVVQRPHGRCGEADRLRVYRRFGFASSLEARHLGCGVSKACRWLSTTP